MKKRGLNIAFVAVILLLSLPGLQMIFKFFEEKPLNGAFIVAEKPILNYGNWMNGTYQQQMESYIKDHSGLKSFMVRLQNQLDFLLFRQANAEGAVVGNNGQLFEYDYIRSWMGIDYPGDSFLEKKLQRTRWVQDYLKREKNIDLVVVFEPGKASFYEEYLPDKYRKQKTGPSTYERYRHKAEEAGIDFIDLQQYFLQLKPSAEYPLFPRYGTHWSVYGMRFAADSILRLIEQKRNISLTAAKADSMFVSSEPFNTDDDVLKTMNLLLPMKGEELAYPVYSFDTLHPGTKPMVLVVADSYYWNIFNTRIPKYIFANEAFWYFNTLVYPDHYIQPTYTKDINFHQEIEKQDIIFLMITERFVHKFDWRFIDQIYELYTPDWIQDPVYEKINDIMMLAPWYAEVIKRGHRFEISLEQALIKEGKYLYHQSDTAGYFIDYGLEHYMKVITDDQGWMEAIRDKAKKQGESEETALKEDALFIFQQDHPVLFELNRSKAAFELEIRNDPALMEQVKNEATSYHVDLETFIGLKAYQMVKEDEFRKTAHAILSDPSWYADVMRKATEKGITTEEMIRLDAEYLFNEKLKSH